MVVWHLRAVVIISSCNYAKQLLSVIEPTEKDNFCGYKISSENRKKFVTTDELTTNIVNRHMITNYYYYFLNFSTYFARKTAYFLCKTKIYNGKINKSYDIMFGKSFVLKKLLLHCRHRLH